MWRSLGIDLRPDRAKRSFGCPAAPIALAILLAVGPTYATAGSRGAAGRIDSLDAGQSAYAEGRFIEALRIWRPLAERGDARAAFGLGLLYDLGEGVEQNAVAAYGWYLRAAEAGYVLAEFNVGVLCDSGVGIARNPTDAALWYARAAAHGYARAEYNLAQLYEAGDGAPRNLDMAESWYAAAAAQGLSAAAHKVESLREERSRATVSLSAEKPALAAAVPAASPVTSAPEAGQRVQVELSWAAPSEPVPVDFFVQVLALGDAGARRVFTGYSHRSAVLVSLPQAPTDYAWRIYTVADSVRDYVPSRWSYFSTR